MKVYYSLILLFIFSRNCFGQLLENRIEYKIIDSYIFTESYEQKKNDCKDCDNENMIFKINKKFIYSYQYLDSNRKAFLLNVLDNGKWNFVSLSSTEPKVVRIVELQILPNGLWFENPFYCQTRIGYKFHEKLANISMTGLIENPKNIWFHPPREYLFQILELNPFPYIKSPYIIGNEWKWELEIGGQWGDKRWREWKGNIHNFYHYKIVESTTIKSKLGNLKCFVIEGIAKSELGETKLRSYFNEEYGFVKLEYTNIDKSKIELMLERIESPPIFKY